MAANTLLNAPNNFQANIRRYTHENGWQVQELSEKGAVLRFTMPSGRTKDVWVLPMGNTLEFSVQSAADFGAVDDMPHKVSTALLQRNSDRRFCFWSIIALNERFVYTCMHNAESQLMNSVYFGNVVRELLEECSVLDDVVDQYEQQQAKGVVLFKQWRCQVEKKQYTDTGRTALLLYDAEDGERIAVATYNDPDVRLAGDEVLIREEVSEGYGGMTEALIKGGVVKPTGRFVQYGDERFPICKCLI